MHALVFAALIVCSPAFAQAPEPIPVRGLFANPNHETPQLSPNGKHLASIHNANDVQAVIVHALAGGDSVPVLVFNDPEFRLASVTWANDDRLLLVGETRDWEAIRVRARATRLYGIDRSGKNLRWLGKSWHRTLDYFPTQFEDRIVHLTPEEPASVLIALEGAVYRMNVTTGRLQQVRANRRRVGRWFADRSGVIRAGEGSWVERTGAWARADGEAEFEALWEYDDIAADGPEFAGFHEDQGKLYVRAPHEGRTALFEFEIASKKLGRLVFAHPEVDVGDVVTGPAPARLPVAIAYTHDRPAVHFIDARARAEHRALLDVLPIDKNAWLARTSETADGAEQVLLVSSDIQPPVYFHFARKRGAVQLVAELYPDVPLKRLSPARRVDYHARDGLQIPAYLTLPRDGGERQLPLIVLPHGGPWARDAIEWNPEVQLFASRGFAVFQPNFRGSTGFGKAHHEAGYREVGKKIQEDIEDGVAWLVARGVADPDRIGIYGSSHGGYAALMALIETPARYRAGATLAGVSDLAMQLRDDRFYATSLLWQRAMLGGGWGDGERLRAASPVHRAAEIRAPVLVGHGVDDQVVHVKHGRRMVEALREAGSAVEYLEFEHEIHSFLFEANRIRWYEALIAFFEKNLAPRKTADGGAG